MKAPSLFRWLAHALPILLVPVALIGLALRLLLTPWFLEVEYRLPGFPDDPYGFTRAERLHWSRYALNYLLNREDISYLADLRFDDGQPLFNPRELRHMEDVKRVTQGALQAFYGALGALILLGLGSRSGSARQAFWSGVKRGGWITVGLAGLIGVVVALGMFVLPELFWTFFSGFHALFFEGDSWIFAYSDTLIRLFPLRFWQDAFLFAALIAIATGLALGIGIRTSAMTGLSDRV